MFFLIPLPLKRLCLQYQILGGKLVAAIGLRVADFDGVDLNEYGGIGHSNDARRAIKEMRTVFGLNFVIPKN